MKNLISRVLVGKKTSIFLWCFIGALTLLVACKPNEPEWKEVTPETCRKALMQYFPYSVDEEFVFYNESLDHRTEAKAYDTYNDGIYPDIFMENENGNDSSEWYCSIRAYMFNNRINPDSIAWTHYGVEEVSAYIANHPSEQAAPIQMIWRVVVRLDLMNGLIAYTDVHCEKSELASLLTDTITLPVRSNFSFDLTRDTTVMDGACVHIVKNEGIIDFTLDGQTFWKRVKE